MSMSESRASVGRCLRPPVFPATGSCKTLTNVVGHAGPTTAHLEVRFRPEQLDIEVIHDGPRFPMPEIWD